MKGLHSALPVVLACLALITGTTRSADSKTCIPGLVKGYLMDGLESPKKINLEMCPLVRNSCCAMTDQAVLFKNWVLSDQYLLREKFQNDLAVYTELLEESVRVQDLAYKMQRNLSDRLLSNCKVLSRRITHFKIREVVPKLKEITKNFHKFIDTTYSGFYCTICNADLQRYIKTDAEQIVYSERFCRDIITNSLHYLLYFHVHLINYINLQIKFLSFCDGNGKYVEQPIEELLYQSSEYKGSLLECRDARNLKPWLTKCLDICTKFNMVQFRDFFRPNVRPFKETTLTLSELRKKMKASLKRRTLIDSVKMTGRRRVLTEQGATNGEAEDIIDKKKEAALLAEMERKRLLKEKRLNDPTVFKSDEVIIPLEGYHPVFEEFGLNLADSGREMNFDSDLARKLDKIRTAGISEDEEVEDEDAPAFPGMGVEDARETSGAGLTKSMFAILTILMLGYLM